MFKWWKEYREKLMKEQFDRGYNFAAATLLRSKGLQDISELIHIKNFDNFDYGMIEAERDWCNLWNKK